LEPYGLHKVFKFWILGKIPFLNTVPLLSSGASVTWAHHALLARYRQQAIAALFVTVALAVLFTGFQAYEYFEAPFDISGGIFGWTPFLATGFHEFHEIIGTIFLIFIHFPSCGKIREATQQKECGNEKFVVVGLSFLLAFFIRERIEMAQISFALSIHPFPLYRDVRVDVPSVVQEQEVAVRAIDAAARRARAADEEDRAGLFFFLEKTKGGFERASAERESVDSAKKLRPTKH
jgi:hypothetical protein